MSHPGAVAIATFVVCCVTLDVQHAVAALTLRHSSCFMAIFMALFSLEQC